MKCIAQGVHDENVFQVRLHGGKVKNTFNYRKHVGELRTKSVDKIFRKKLDSLGDNLLRKQEAIGRQRTRN